MDRQQVSEKALKKLKEHNYVGTIVLSTGTGKSKIAIDAIKAAGLKRVLITSPRTNLKENWKKEIEKWGYIGRVTIENVQTAYKWSKSYLEEFDIIIFDEIHTMVTENYGDLIIRAYEGGIKRIGLTATPDISKREDKEDFYLKYCPIILQYHDSEKHGITNKKQVYALRYDLTDDYLYEVKTKKKSWKQGELSFYKYLESTIMECTNKVRTIYPNWDVLGIKAVYALKNPNAPAALKQILSIYWWAITQRKKLLWTLQSSAEIAKTVKERILTSTKRSGKKDNKVLLFSELTEKCDKLSAYSLHSKQDKDINQILIDNFNSGKIKELASCQSLTLGMNLTKANYAIFESFNSSETNNLQKQGRLNRLPIADEAILIYIVPRETQAEVWFNEATINQEVREININQI